MSNSGPSESMSESVKVTVSGPKQDNYPCLCKPKCKACQFGNHKSCVKHVDCTAVGF